VGQGVMQGWDGFGRLAASGINQGGTMRSLTSLYDDDGNRVRLTYPDSNYITFAYDGLDRMTTVKQSGTTTIATYTYNNRTDVAARGNGGEASTYSYDNIGRLSSILHNLASTANDVTLGFTAWNAVSQLITRTISNDNYAYTPVAAVNASYTANGLNQYANVAGANYS
jgi:YD repeat-containing protein